MSDIAGFIEARLDDDERIARWVVDNNYANHSARWTESSSGVVEVGDDDIITGDSALSRHIERWDPKRVRDEVVLKRGVMEWCVEVIGDRDLSTYGQFGFLRDDPQALAVTLAVETLRLLAQPYADHPDYDPGWTLAKAVP